MAARTASPVLPVVVVLLLLCGAFAPAFVPPAGASVSQASSLRGAAPLVAFGALGAALPMPAQAFSETELNQFGLAFSIFFLGFWIAGFFRLLTVGKL
ncbi:unnamed protein product [Polarella glacialis]|uniref:Uncharacterized protein n=1 Tax=Polarella glacialis TaxID=89957 RepID=A0A813KVF6_POLGL|nr:unnamed protein product [Polarella glacialis]CAE8711425.1 unnamed protein product [Polarella glacialis]|mmetsp:Transcript_30615/g.49103  ORF Transcript_30615/g.49103 Transcript_30615/m.49103 type:complete len:98 (+) Transcript_30615:107-400(+)